MVLLYFVYLLQIMWERLYKSGLSLQAGTLMHLRNLINRCNISAKMSVTDHVKAFFNLWFVSTWLQQSCIILEWRSSVILQTGILCLTPLVRPLKWSGSNYRLSYRLSWRRTSSLDSLHRLIVAGAQFSSWTAYGYVHSYVHSEQGTSSTTSRELPALLRQEPQVPSVPIRRVAKRWNFWLRLSGIEWWHAAAAGIWRRNQGRRWWQDLEMLESNANLFSCHWSFKLHEGGYSPTGSCNSIGCCTVDLEQYWQHQRWQEKEWTRLFT